MGYIKHHAIVVTSWKSEAIEEAVEKAAGLSLQVLGPSDPVVNGYRSILVCPDGSKEGWDESDLGDKRRAAFKTWLMSTRYDDGSGPLEWAEIAYGNDDEAAEIAGIPWGAK